MKTERTRELQFTTPEEVESFEAQSTEGKKRSDPIPPENEKGGATLLLKVQLS